MSKPRILLVEDDAIIRMDLELCLRDLGMEVAAKCSTGEEAIELVGRINLDLVLMDIILPGEIDGTEAGMQIRLKFDIPLVYLSGHCSESMLERAKLSEPDGYLLKPYDRKSLRRTLQRALNKREVELTSKEASTSFFDFVTTGTSIWGTGPNQG